MRDFALRLGNLRSASHDGNRLRSRAIPLQTKREVNLEPIRKFGKGGVLWRKAPQNTHTQIISG